MGHSRKFNHFSTGRPLTVRSDIYDRAITYLDSLEGPQTVRQIAAEVGCTELKINDILCGADGQLRVGQGKVAVSPIGPNPTWAKNHSNVAYGDNSAVLQVPEVPDHFDTTIAADWESKMIRYVHQLRSVRKSPARLQAEINDYAESLTKSFDDRQLHKNTSAKLEDRLVSVEGQLTDTNRKVALLLEAPARRRQNVEG